MQVATVVSGERLADLCTSADHTEALSGGVAIRVYHPQHGVFVAYQHGVLDQAILVPGSVVNRDLEEHRKPSGTVVPFVRPRCS